MQKLSAVRKNLFGTSVDRGEMERNMEQVEAEGTQTLRGFTIESTIGVIPSDSYHQTRKRLSDSQESSADESDDESQRLPATTDCPPSNDEASSSGGQSTQRSSSTKTDLPLIQQQLPLPKGQKTIKRKTNQLAIRALTSFRFLILDYFPIIKRQRQHRRWGDKHQQQTILIVSISFIFFKYLTKAKTNWR